MADFRTLYEQQKWNTISNIEKEAMQRLADGEATQEDLELAQKLIVQYRDVISDTFKDGLKSLSLSADDRILRIAEDRELKGKPELTEYQFNRLMELALKKEWETKGPELAQVFSQEIELNGTEQLDKINNLLEAMGDEVNVPRKQEEVKKTTILESKIGEVKESVDNIEFPEPLEVKTVEVKEDKDTVVSGRPLTDTEVIEKLQEVFPKEEEDKVESVQSTIYEQKIDEHKKEDGAEGKFIELTDSLIEHANNSFRTTQDLQSELEDLTNEDTRKKRENSRIKKWWRAFKSVAAPVTRKSRSLALGLTALVARLLLTEVMGGRLWDRLKDEFSWTNIKRISTALYEVGKVLMKSGWEKLDEYLTLDFIKKILRAAGTWGISASGMVYEKTKEFFGISNEEPAPITVPAPNALPQPITDKEGNVLPQESTNSPTAVPSPRSGASGSWSEPAASGTTIEFRGGGASGSWGDSSYSTSSGTVTYPENAATVPSPSTDSTAVDSPRFTENPADDVQIKKDPLSAKGANSIPSGNAKPQDISLDLGSAAKNEIPEAKEPVELSSARPVNEAKGGIHATFAGFSRNVSVDGTLPFANASMFS